MGGGSGHHVASQGMAPPPGMLWKQPKVARGDKMKTTGRTQGGEVEEINNNKTVYAA